MATGSSVAPAAGTVPTTAEVADEPRSNVLVDFTDQTEADRWATVNDPVMGGLSTSEIVPAADGLVFAGVVSLENNGGFASLRGPEDPELGPAAAGAEALRVRARGDGKTYVLQVRRAGEQWSYVQRFTTTADTVESYDLAVADFEAVDFFLNPAPAAPQRLDPAGIDQIAVYILDKQDGPFALTLVSIDALT